MQSVFFFVSIFTVLNKKKKQQPQFRKGTAFVGFRTEGIKQMRLYDRFVYITNISVAVDVCPI